MSKALEFDYVAQTILFPIYPVIAEDMLSYTGIRNGRMLDIGCGGGHMGLSVLKAAPELRGILLDKNPEAACIADRRAAEWGLRDRTVVVVGDVQQLPLPDGSIDLAVSRGSLPFWENLEKAFSEILRVLAPGGMAYLGGGMGNKELAESVEKKMREFNPDWPCCVRRKSNGLGADDYRIALQKLGAEFEILEGERQGKWTVIFKNSLERRDRKI
ncbi:putative methyltransferase [Oscillibacter valericigenes Sjm18-20]|nr:putative methyltransferase [Oscillibacter valericigenes Sjm18-20]